MWGWVGQGKMVAEKWRQLYWNNNQNLKKERRKEKGTSDVKHRYEKILKSQKLVMFTQSWPMELITMAPEERPSPQ